MAGYFPLEASSRRRSSRTALEPSSASNRPRMPMPASGNAGTGVIAGPADSSVSAAKVRWKPGTHPRSAAGRASPCAAYWIALVMITLAAQEPLTRSRERGWFLVCARRRQLCGSLFSGADRVPCCRSVRSSPVSRWYHGRMNRVTNPQVTLDLARRRCLRLVLDRIRAESPGSV